MKLISVFKTPIIEFMCREEDYGVIPAPTPAMKNIPKWYKDIPPYVPNGKDSFGGKGMTAKKCLPMLDAMCMGFVIPLAGDVHLKSNKDCGIINVGVNPSLGPLIEFHDKEQIGGKNSPIFPKKPIKFINKWFIKTAPGYSAMFVPCINSLESRFTVFSALVDTDKYYKEVNFPAAWNVPDFDGVLPAGTPLITVIPIRRKDLVKTANVRVLSKKEAEVVHKMMRIQTSRNHYYTHELRNKDEH
jgi:hypothetical protein